MNAARASYARSLEVRDRIAGAGATTTAAGLAMGAPVMAAVKSYTSMEDAMKGVAKQVNGLRDDNGNRTARFMKCRMPSRLPANSCRWKTVRWTSLHWLKVVRA